MFRRKIIIIKRACNSLIVGNDKESCIITLGCNDTAEAKLMSSAIKYEDENKVKDMFTLHNTTADMDMKISIKGPRKIKKWLNKLGFYTISL